jgi:hypothetical protein
MKKMRLKWNYATVIYALIVLLWIGYTLLLFLSRSNNQYHLGFAAINVIRITFTVPILGVWLAGTMAAIRFRDYAKLIDGSKEAPGFRLIAIGLAYLAAYLIAVFMTGRIAPLFAGTPVVLLMVFIKNHLPVYLLLIAFVQVFRGAFFLADQAGAKLPRRTLLTINIAYLAFTVGFVAIFFSNLVPREALVSGIPAFSVPHSVLLATLIFPSLVSWQMGILASFGLWAYVKRTKGLIYRAMLKQLLIGIAATTVFAILTELIVLMSSQLSKLGLNAVLLIVYLFLIAYAVGAVFIMRGARKLTLIEVAQ